jgi:hypothetical protein
MRTRVLGLLAAAAISIGAPVSQAASSSHQPAVAAKSCSAGYVHASFRVALTSALGRAQFCSHRRGYQRVYHQHGFHCKRNGHLTYH